MNIIKSLALVFLVGITLPSLTLSLASSSEIGIETPSSIEGKYIGSLTYTTSTGKLIAKTEGVAEILKIDNTYTINFSDGVPSIIGLKFQNEDGSYVTIKSSNSVSGIVIDDGDLSIGVTKNGNTWAFNGEK